jgi:hypothetical protein
MVKVFGDDFLGAAVFVVPTLNCENTILPVLCHGLYAMFIRTGLHMLHWFLLFPEIVGISGYGVLLVALSSVCL